MDLVEIKDFPNYSFDKNTNQVYSHNYNKYLTPNLSNGYYRIKLNKNNKQKNYQLHRLIYQMYYPDIDITNLEIDHIDNKPLNNNIENLRHCNRSENNCNTKVHKNNLLGVKNISLTKYNNYQVQIKKNKIRYTKTFKTLEEAIEYRDNKLIELHREFHNLG
tara:strand:- start:27 stop:512 length:486 start_codon:yes stop_codon:yes gene_type:complete